MDKKCSYFQIKDFNELNERKVIIFGASKGGSIIENILLRNNVKENNILFFCDNNSSLWGKTKDNKKIISPNELKEYCKNNKNIIIFIATIVERISTEIIKQIKENNIKNTVIFGKEIILLEKVLVHNSKELEKRELEVYKRAQIEQRKAIERYEFYYQLFDNIDRHDMILFLTPSKTGSSTICESLPFEYPIKRTHTTNWMLLEDKINCKKYVRKMIIGVREAIATNVSHIFQLKEHYCVAQAAKRLINPQDVLESYIIDSILNPKKREEKNYGFENEAGHPLLIQSWFEDEIETRLGINIFDYPFDKKCGYQIIKINNCEILLYRLESLDCLEEVFGKFLDIKGFKFIRENEAKYKWYNKSYQSFLANMTIPQEYINISYNSRYMKHFYTEEEILGFRRKWEKYVK